MFAYNEKKYMKCGKCGMKVDFSDDRKLAEMGVSMKGVTRDSRLARINRSKGLEVTKSYQPKNRVCKGCQNFRIRVQNTVAQKQHLSKGTVKEMSNTEVLDIFHRRVKAKLRKEQQEARRKDAEEKKYVETQEALKNKKAQKQKAETVKDALIKEMLEKKKQDEKPDKGEKKECLEKTK